MKKEPLGISLLRGLFTEQWAHVLHLVEEQQQRSYEKSAHNRHLTLAVEHIIDRVDARIRGTRNYHHLLCQHAHNLLEHIQELISYLPEPITINRDSYLSEPLINALFTSSNELEELIIQSIRSHHKTPLIHQENEEPLEVNALLAFHREEKQVLGKKMIGDLIQSDVPQTAITFYGLQITAAAYHTEMAPASLEQHIFERIISLIRSNMIRLRQNQIIEDGDKAALHPKQNMNNPETYLRVLSEQLSTPQSVVQLQRSEIKVSKMGLLLSDDSMESSNQLALQELVIGGNTKQAITPIRFHLNEWRD